MVLPKCVKSLKPNQQDTFVNRIDSDVVTSFAELLYKIIELDAEAYVMSANFDQTINLFCEVLAVVSEEELQRTITLVLLIVI